MADLQVIKTKMGLRSWCHSVQSEPQVDVAPDEFSSTLGQIGLVPTMGSLHAGHLALIRRACLENQWGIVTIFVNPLQFAAGEDLEDYPRTLEADIQLCQAAGVDVIFAPETAELLGEQPLTQVIPPLSLTAPLCGSSRPGHFQGVATIVLQLLNLVQPDRAYFGRKDAQQLAIIQRLVRDLNLAVDIVPCTIARDEKGLAYSSRNQYLSPQEQQQATVLSRSLQQAQTLFLTGTCDREALLGAIQAELSAEPQVQPEYVDLVDPITLAPLETIGSVGLVAIAAQVGKARLIDNLLLDRRPPILAVDGPAGAGKSTVTRLSAATLNLLYLDTGAMYRAVTWFVLQAGCSPQDQLAIADLVGQCHIQLQPAADPHRPPQVFVNGQAVTQAIRSPEVTAAVSAIAAQPAIRESLVQQQRSYGEAGGVAAEGRDIGTHVFPEAGLKIFLTASIQERARRRQQDDQVQGAHAIPLDQLAQQIWERDRQDSHRAIAPLRRAYDAVEINTDGLSIAAVTEKIVTLYRSRCQ